MRAGRYQLRGGLDCWLRLDVDRDGSATVSGIDLSRRSFTIAPPGASFLDEGGDGPTIDDVARLNDLEELANGAAWALSKVEDDEGNVYLDA